MTDRTRWLFLLALVGCASRQQSVVIETAQLRAYQLDERGRTEYSLGHYKEAAMYFETAYETYPDDWRIVFNLGQSYRMAFQYTKAVEVFRRIVKRAPAEIPDRERFLDQLPEVIHELEELIAWDERMSAEEERIRALLDKMSWPQ